ncbi:TPA: LPS export ABC transporter periplasmic protein LptC [Candidatus Marinimicrobia bacterium]|nr:LPS export ABC transporter periplasmic protein LptC [Candidatus Neomarinimicrobiota bacterium]HBY19143.1 LPS export ABC transporter periplasmic protein LptC [Candidatus Neomarinimicrobiota bacterium]
MKGLIYKQVSNLLLMGSAVLFLLSACSQLDEKELEKAWESPDQESWNAVLTMSRQDKLSARVYAGRMKQFNETGEVYIGDSMRVDFYNDEGRHTSFLKSDSGIVNEKKQNLIAIGNVEFRSDTGYVMYTNTLFWLNDSNLVYTDGDIELFSERDTLYGTGFRSDVRLENWTIDKPRGSTRREYDVED